MILPLLFVQGVGAKDVYPPGITSLLGGSHPTQACDYCHSVLIPDRSERNGVLGACICHKDPYSPAGKVDMDLVSRGHDGNPCVRCHTGIRPADLDADQYHLLHLDVECTWCHEKATTGFMVPGMTCDDCHTGGPHVVHGSKTETLCTACHGAYGEQYQSQGIGAPISTTVNGTEDSSGGYVTILGILKSLMGRHLGA